MNVIRWIWPVSLARSMKTMHHVWSKLLTFFQQSCLWRSCKYDCSFYVYEFVNKLILDAWYILDSCKMKYLEYGSLCGSWSCKMCIILWSCVFFNINLLSLYVEVLNNLHHNHFSFSSLDAWVSVQDAEIILMCWRLKALHVAVKFLFYAYTAW